MSADEKRLEAATHLNVAEGNHAIAVDRRYKADAAVAEMEAWRTDYSERVESARAKCREVTAPADRLAAVAELNAVLAELDEKMAQRIHRVRSESGTAEAEYSKACTALEAARARFDAAVAS